MVQLAFLCPHVYTHLMRRSTSHYCIKIVAVDWQLQYNYYIQTHWHTLLMWLALISDLKLAPALQCSALF